jgi:ABC-type transport system substrate-binding protein
MRSHVVLVMSLGLCLAGRARADAPLYEQDPFDQLTVAEGEGSVVLKVKPLSLPERRLPANPQPNDNLLIQLFDQPDKKYEVAWQSIKKVELFEQMLLGKANELVVAGQLDEAYDYIRFLEENYPRTPGLPAASEEYLFRQAKAFYGRQQYRGALGVLRELYRRNPQRPKLDAVMGAMTEKLVEQYAAGGDFCSVRAMLRSLAGCYPGHPLVGRWETRLKQEAAGLLSDARAAEQAGDLRKAAAALRRVALLWPALAGARELAAAVHAKYPRVVVGVCQPAPEMSPARGGGDEGLLTDWAARRRARLVYRTLAEFAGARASGGQYACPVGEIKVAEDGRRVAIQLRPGLRWSAGEATLTGYDVSRRLLAMSDPADPAYRPDWARLCDGVAVREVQRVDVDLRQAHLRPQAFLQTILLPYSAARTSATDRAACNGPYTYAGATGPEATYLLNTRYSGGTPTQPKEIVERRLADGAAAAAALRHGEIQVLDRLNPWQVKSLRGDKELSVQAYALPRVHCLVPNARKPLTASRTFRRALAYGIDGQAVLEQVLRGDKLPGCAVLHGPFAAGGPGQDSLGYACDPQLKPWPYDPRLATVLAEAARRELAVGKDQAPQASQPGLVLAYPPGETARTACEAIRRQLAAIEVAVELRALPAVPAGPLPPDIDLLYVDLALWEPLVDAPRVLGEDSLAGGCSAQMSESLGQLEQATDWHDAAVRLHRIDRIAHDEVAVLPLYQLTDYFACRKDLKGLEPATLTLYQNVEQWKPGFQYPSESQ